MKPSLWIVRVSQRFGNTWSAVFGERSLDPSEGICLGYFVYSIQAVRRFDLIFGTKRQCLEYLWTNMLDKLWHDRKTANDDAYCKLSPPPETHELQVVSFV